MTSAALYTLALSFLSPALAIAGVACVAVPIIIHLLTRQRRKPIPWAAMKFLLEAYKKHKRRLTLEQLLLLACRCLIVFLVGMALARPVLSDGGSSRGPVHLYLLIDNSLAAQIREQARGASGPNAASQNSDGVRTALDRFKDEARGLLANLDAGRGDRAAVLTLASPADASVLPPSPDLAAIGRVVAEIKCADARADLAGAIGRLRAELAGAGTPDASPASTDVTSRGERARVVVAVLSDLRSGSIDLSQPLTSLGTGEGAALVASLPPAQLPLDNVAIAAVEPLRPIMLADASAPNRAGASASNQVRVTLRRFGPGVSKSATSTVQLSLSDAKSVATQTGGDRALIKWQPGEESASAIMDVHPSDSAGTDAMALVARIDADSLPGDDVFVRSVQGRRGVRVAVIESLRIGSSAGASIDQFSQGDWIRLLLQPDAEAGPLRSGSSSGLEPTTLDPASVGRSGLAGFDAAIVLAPDELSEDGWKRLGEFSAGGGLVMVTPPATEQVHLWGDAFSKALGLDWTVEREIQTLSSPMQLLGETPGGPANPLLGLLSGEVPALAKPVSVSKRLKISAPSGTATTVLSMADGLPLALASLPSAGGTGAAAGEAAAPSASPPSKTPPSESGRGVVVLLACSIDLSWTDLPTKPLMLPLLHETLRVGVGRSQPTFDRVAGRTMRLPQGASELVAADARATDSGHSSITQGIPARFAGVWRAVSPQGATLSLVAVNADTTASDTSPVPEAQATGLLAGIAGADRVVAMTSATDGVGGEGSGGVHDALRADPRQREPISVPLLVSALALALAEVFLARQFSHASRSGDSPRAGSTAT